MIHRPSALGWGGLAGAALAASAGPLVVQLAFAVVAIGVVGMAHGASDLAVVAPERRSAFLLCYGAVSAVCLAWWVGDPAVAVPAFLLASAIHFALEDAPIDRPVERCARGIGLVAAPATFHQSGLAKILALAGMVPPALPVLVAGLALGGVLCAATLVWLGWRRRDCRLVAGTAALLLLPPLVGFSVGFLVLHALPQTAARRREMRLPNTAAYLRAVAPVLVAALVIAAGVGAALLRWEPSGIRPLFAGVAALAVPHLLVTPWFERPRPSSAGGEFDVPCMTSTREV